MSTNENSENTENTNNIVDSSSEPTINTSVATTEEVVPTENVSTENASTEGVSTEDAPTEDVVNEDPEFREQEVVRVVLDHLRTYHREYIEIEKTKERS